MATFSGVLSAPLSVRSPSNGPKEQERRHKNRANDERIKQHAQREREAQLEHSSQRAGQHRGKRARHDDAATGDDAAGSHDGLAKPFQQSATSLFLEDASDQIDIVVFADGHEDYEQEQRQLPIESLECVASAQAQKTFVRPRLTK